MSSGLAGLARLALRRALTPGAIVLWAVLALAVDARAEPGEALRLVAGEDAGAVARGLARQALWIALVAPVAALLLARAAGVVPRWRRGEGDWLGSAPVPAPAVVASTWLGLAAACGAVVALTWAVAALRVPTPDGASPSWRWLRALPAPSAALAEEGDALRWQLDDPRGRLELVGARLRVDCAVLGVGTPAHLRLTARRPSGASASSERSLAARGSIDVDVPGAGDALELALEQVGPGAAAAPLEVALLAPAPESAATRALAARWALGLAAAAALALGAGAWMGSATAALLAALPWLATWLAGRAPAWLPGADLPRALDLVGRGLAPPALPAASLAGAAGLVALGLGVAALGLRSWRRAP